MPSYTELTTWVSCRQKWAYSYRDKLKPIKKAEALEFGSLVHLCLAGYYRGASMWDIAKGLIVSIKAELDRDDEEENQKLMAMRDEVWEMFKAYTSHYGDEEHHVLAVEKRYEEPIVRVVDMITKQPNGLVMAWEHKTTSRKSDDLENEVALSFEPALTCVVSDADGIIYNYLIKTKPPQFHRIEYFPTKQEKVEASIWAQETSYNTTQASQDPPSAYYCYNRSYQCKWCDYRTLCDAQITGGDVEWAMKRYRKQ